MDDKLRALAQEIDDASDRNDVAALRRSIDSIERFKQDLLSKIDRAALDFYAANAYASLRHEARGDQDWTWQQPLLENEIYHLRLALNQLNGISISEIETDLKFRISTNLANALDHVGRFVEAIELWDQTLSEYPRFAMAIGNRAQAFFWYSRFQSDHNTQALFLKESHAAFSLAVSLGVEAHAQEHVENWVAHLRTMADWEKVDAELPTFRKGRSKVERQYRRWCVQRRLVLNTVNDLIQNTDGLPDDLTLPPIALPVAESSASLPKPYAIFNQLKQEYASARYLVFDALQEEGSTLHFADKGIVLYDALDYRYYRLWVEKLKMAFLSAHAILDKIAYLVNEYWKLALNVRIVSFHSVWCTDGRSKLGLAKTFESSQNWPLRGLYWLSKDFYHRSKADSSVNPNAKVIHEIRNHIAHKYLRVHDHVLYAVAAERAQLGYDLSYPISDLELQEHSINLLKLVRSALIYLSSAVAHEERDRSESSMSGLIMPMPVTLVSDKYRL